MSWEPKHRHRHIYLNLAFKHAIELFDEPEVSQLQTLIDKLGEGKETVLSAAEANLLYEALDRASSEIGALIT